MDVNKFVILMFLLHSKMTCSSRTFATNIILMIKMYADLKPILIGLQSISLIHEKARALFI